MASTLTYIAVRPQFWFVFSSSWRMLAQQPHLHPMKVALLFAAVTSTVASGLAQASSYKLEAQSTSEVFSTKILKVYQAEGEAGTFTAYVVDWRGQEVVILPPPLPGNPPALKAGDTVRCLMTRFSPSIDPEARSGHLHFSFAPATATEQADRLRLIAEEVRRRRTLRASAAAQTTSSSTSATAEGAPQEERLTVEEVKRRAAENPAASPTKP